MPNFQVSKINPETNFSFVNQTNLGYPLAPLVAAKYLKSNNSVLIRICVFIDANNSSVPSINPNASERGDTLLITVDYDFSEIIPEQFKCWYLEFEYTSETAMNITNVQTNMTDIDPITSRGTTTRTANPNI